MLFFTFLERYEGIFFSNRSIEWIPFSVALLCMVAWAKDEERESSTKLSTSASGTSLCFISLFSGCWNIDDNLVGKLRDVFLRKNCFLLEFVQMRAGGGPCPNFLAQDVQFLSIKESTSSKMLIIWTLNCVLGCMYSIYIRYSINSILNPKLTFKSWISTSEKRFTSCPNWGEGKRTAVFPSWDSPWGVKCIPLPNGLVKTTSQM